VRWATGSGQACPNAHNLPAAAQLAHCRTPRQRYIARQRCQRYRASPLPYPLPTATQLAHCHTACLLLHSLSTATQLAHCHSSPTVHSLSTVTQLAHCSQLVHCHTARQRYITRQQDAAYQLLHSLLMVLQIANYNSVPAATGLANGT